MHKEYARWRYEIIAKNTGCTYPQFHTDNNALSKVASLLSDPLVQYRYWSMTALVVFLHEYLNVVFFLICRLETL